MPDLKIQKAPSFKVSVYIAGDFSVARQLCREWTYAEGACVTVTPTSYVYTGGMEDGVEVGFINYPRFPASSAEILDKAERLGLFLMEGLFQSSFTIQTPIETFWYSRRGDT